jgi:hypothetical protein
MRDDPGFGFQMGSPFAPPPRPTPAPRPEGEPPMPTGDGNNVSGVLKNYPSNGYNVIHWGSGKSSGRPPWATQGGRKGVAPRI